eukprot:Nitzschia sp. Nitz4//scaffold6_size259037//174957//176069//NITZ4_001095-RA/size259037-processed-gene-0.27-mRNA-1//1//CDS//3329556956//4398//frame0
MPFVHSQYLRPEASSGKLLYSWIQGRRSTPSAFEETKEYQVDEEAPDPVCFLEVDAEVADFTSCEQQLLPLTTNAQVILTEYPDEEVEVEVDSEEEDQVSGTATPLAITKAEPVDATTTVVVNSANFNEYGTVTATEVTPYDEENVFQDFNLRVALISVRLPREAFVGEKLILSNPSSKALRIIAMSKTGLLAESPLHVGCVLQSINNRTCKHLSPSEALLAMLAEPMVYITAVDPAGETSFVHAKVYNNTEEGSGPTNRTNIGVTFVQGRREGLFIEKVHNDGLFAHSVLNEQDQVFVINGVSCQHMFPSEAMALAGRNGSLVSILAKQHRETAVVVSFSRNDFSSRMAILVFLVVCCASVSLAVFLHH